ncbi:heme peroxidase [Cyathus striatus]|nr:heme peroxidase [Cyathus striatus]
MAFVRSVTISLAIAAVSYAAFTKRVICPDRHVAANRACCALFPVVQNFQENLFDGSECGEEAHSALRLAFRDAIGFSLNSNQGGGADGSILLFNATELQFHANAGIDDITARQFPVFQTTGLTPVGFVHLAGAAPIHCQFMFGRLPPIAPAPDHTVPEPSGKILLISPNVIDVTIPGTPFDSTIGTFDTQVFLEVLLAGSLFPCNGSQPGEVLSPIAGEMRLQSAFVVLGQDVNKMVDCSDVILQPAPFAGPIKFPASFSMADVEQACASTFPHLQTVASPTPTVAPVLGS